MGGKTVTRADLAEAVFRRLGLSRTESASMVEMVLKEISDAIVSGETVKLSSFGSFMIRDKGLRVGRNPKTGTRGSDPAAPRDGVQAEQHHEEPHQRGPVAGGAMRSEEAAE